MLSYSRIKLISKLYPNHPCIGKISSLPKEDNFNIITETYEDLKQFATCVGGGLKKLKAATSQNVRFSVNLGNSPSCKCIGTLLSNGYEAIKVEAACSFAGYVPVPLCKDINLINLEPIIAETGIKSIIISAKLYETLSSEVEGFIKKKMEHLIILEEVINFNKKERNTGVNNLVKALTEKKVGIGGGIGGYNSVSQSSRTPTSKHLRDENLEKQIWTVNMMLDEIDLSEVHENNEHIFGADDIVAIHYSILPTSFDRSLKGVALSTLNIASVNELMDSILDFYRADIIPGDQILILPQSNAYIERILASAYSYKGGTIMFVDDSMQEGGQQLQQPFFKGSHTNKANDKDHNVKTVGQYLHQYINQTQCAYVLLNDRETSKCLYNSLKEYVNKNWSYASKQALNLGMNVKRSRYKATSKTDHKKMDQFLSGPLRNSVAKSLKGMWIPFEVSDVERDISCLLSTKIMRLWPDPILSGIKIKMPIDILSGGKHHLVSVLTNSPGAEVMLLDAFTMKSPSQKVITVGSIAFQGNRVALGIITSPSRSDIGVKDVISFTGNGQRRYTPGIKGFLIGEEYGYVSCIRETGAIDEVTLKQENNSPTALVRPSVYSNILNGCKTISASTILSLKDGNELVCCLLTKQSVMNELLVSKHYEKEYDHNGTSGPINSDDFDGRLGGNISSASALVSSIERDVSEALIGSRLRPNLIPNIFIILPPNISGIKSEIGVARCFNRAYTMSCLNQLLLCINDKINEGTFRQLNEIDDGLKLYHRPPNTFIFVESAQYQKYLHNANMIQIDDLTIDMEFGQKIEQVLPPPKETTNSTITPTLDSNDITNNSTLINKEESPTTKSSSTKTSSQNYRIPKSLKYFKKQSTKVLFDLTNQGKQVVFNTKEVDHSRDSPNDNYNLDQIDDDVDSQPHRQNGERYGSLNRKHRTSEQSYSKRSNARAFHSKVSDVDNGYHKNHNNSSDYSPNNNSSPTNKEELFSLDFSGISGAGFSSKPLLTKRQQSKGVMGRKKSGISLSEAEFKARKKLLNDIQSSGSEIVVDNNKSRNDESQKKRIQGGLDMKKKLSNNDNDGGGNQIVHEQNRIENDPLLLSTKKHLIATANIPTLKNVNVIHKKLYGSSEESIDMKPHSLELLPTTVRRQKNNNNNVNRSKAPSNSARRINNNTYDQENLSENNASRRTKKKSVSRSRKNQ